MRVVERQVAGELQVERQLGAAVGAQHGQVVDLPHLGHAQGGGEGPFTERALVALRLDVDDDVALRQRLVDGGLDGVRRRVTLPDGGARRNADHDVGELAPRRLPHPQAPQLDPGLQTRDRGARSLLRLGRSAVHEHVDVVPHQARGGPEHEHGDEQRRRRVGVMPARADAEQADQHRDRSRQIAREMRRVGAECGAVVAAGGAERDDRTAEVDGDDEGEDGQRVPLHVHRRLREAGEVRDRPPDDEQAGEDEDRGLRER